MIHLNKLFLSVCLIATCSLCVLQCRADPIGSKPGELITLQGFQLSLSASSREFAVSTPIAIDTFITNVTDKQIVLGMNSNLAEYRFEVKNEEGESMPLTRFGQRVQSNRGTNFGIGSIEIPPGKNYSQKVVLNQLYDMSIPGQYLVKVTHTIGVVTEKNPKEPVDLISNVLHITVR